MGDAAGRADEPLDGHMTADIEFIDSDHNRRRAVMEAAEAPEGEGEVAGEIGPDDGSYPEMPTSVNLLKEDLPLPLQDRHEELDHALNETPPPMDLGQDVRYQKATDVRRIAAILIEEFHDHLEDVRAVYWYRSSIQAAGKTSTPPGRWRSFTGVEFYVDIDHSTWVELSARDRIRLVDHELCHVGWDVENGKATLGEHEIEEYSTIIRRWGPTPAQEGFVEACQQIEMTLEEAEERDA